MCKQALSGSNKGYIRDYKQGLDEDFWVSGASLSNFDTV